jgi:hypothetical protein
MKHNFLRLWLAKNIRAAKENMEMVRKATYKRELIFFYVPLTLTINVILSLISCNHFVTWGIPYEPEGCVMIRQFP